MRLTLKESIEVIIRRAKLFVNGEKSGVGIWWLSGLMPFYSELESISFAGYSTNLVDLGKSRQKSLDIIKDLKIKTSPDNWNAGNNLATFLIDCVRKSHPKVILETGVANGVSTLVIQDAIGKRDIEFHSIDTNILCAEINKDSKKWYFHHLEGRNLKRQFEKIVGEIPKVDLWVHDSDHHYIWQSFEYKIALEKLNPGGILVSDDVDFSKAWAELSKSREVGFICTVFDGRKCFGVAQKK